MDSDNVTVLYAEVVADNSVDACAAVIEIIISQDDENRVLSLLALDKDRVATEELECLHGVVRERDNRVVIVGSVGDTAQRSVWLSWTNNNVESYIREFGFFFFLRMAVDTSFSTWGAS